MDHFSRPNSTLASDPDTQAALVTVADALKEAALRGHLAVQNQQLDQSLPPLDGFTQSVEICPWAPSSYVIEGVGGVKAESMELASAPSR